MFLQCGYWFTAPFRSCNVTSVICFPVGAIRTITTTKNILIKNWLRFVKKKTTKTTEMNSILQEDLREWGGVGSVSVEINTVRGSHASWRSLVLSPLSGENY